MDNQLSINCAPLNYVGLYDGPAASASPCQADCKTPSPFGAIGTHKAVGTERHLTFDKLPPLHFPLTIESTCQCALVERQPRMALLSIVNAMAVAVRSS